MNKRGKRKKRWLWLVVILFLALNIPGLKNIWTLHHEIERLKREETTLLEEQKRLNEQVARLKSDQEIERMAREQLGLIKPGEHVLVPVVKNGHGSPY